jgi:diaminopimelate epimerase
MRFAKGHGTGNDFLILTDSDDAVALSPDLVARLCDRRTGLGADGILRAVRVPAAGRTVPAWAAGAAEWFMDYRNADGSIAEMCGNGIRVFARYLLGHGLAEGPELAVATRAGPRLVRAEPGGEFTVDMGAPAVHGHAVAVIGSASYDGLAVSLGNPHLACVVGRPVAEFNLSVPPAVDHARFPDGANVEVVRVLGDRHLEMRVHERGSGATLSCGTGAVAAAVAAAEAAGEAAEAAGEAGRAAAAAGEAGRAAAAAGEAGRAAAAAGEAGRAAGNGHTRPAGAWSVQVPGGTLTVTLTETTSLLTGPAVIVAEGELDQGWLAAQTAAATAVG